MGIINAFVVMFLYYLCLYTYIDEITEEPMLVHLCVVYSILDFLLLLASFIQVNSIKQDANLLINDPKYTEYSDDAKAALADIMYLPLGENEDDDVEEEY